MIIAMTDTEMILNELKNHMQELKSHYEILHQLAINQDIMQKDISSMKADIAATQTDISSMKKDITNIKITLENNISPAIKMLSELQVENSSRLVRLEKGVQDINDSVVIDEVLSELRNRN
jgi:flagellar biosynthesis chaperone FliJ